ncbi:DUF805 domain-containing protein [uncultured Algibacter sp.]|uniref:DUF805 domain-containing protein n=1 Tax=uncultured Algibacter sp. TaxID=298659 RepID=UPI002617E82B|nr:DUF805 domain-containing protein [uncultured Algibacter sp.]
MNWYLDMFTKKYASFKGRTRRKDFWLFLLFNITITLVVVFIISFISNNLIKLQDYVSIMPFIFFIGLLIPTLAAISRRLHDIGKSGTYFLVYFIPFIGGIWLFVLLVSNGDKGPNKYGPDPKGPILDEIDEIGKPQIEN